MDSIGNYTTRVQNEVSRLKSPEHMLGKALIQPFADSNSGSRKLLFSVQADQALELLHAEVPIIQTGYENRYGDLSSSIIKAESDYDVVGKVCKFESNPQMCYYLILRDKATNVLHVRERIKYFHTTETYGYNYDTQFYDSLEVGFEISKDAITRHSISYDEYMNRCDGVNLLATYIATDITMEDGMLISEAAAKKLASPLIKKVEVNVNENDILLNLMGNDEVYKSFPSIGEEISHGVLCAIRREKIEDSLFTQSVQRLKQIMMSDEKYVMEGGRVIDINIRCNNPAALAERHTNYQVLYYYNDHIRFIKEFCNTIDSLRAKYGSTLSIDLGEMYTNFDRELKGALFLDQKVSNGTRIEFIIQEDNIPHIGDKITNRYGGKGVISKILPVDQMPRLADTKEPLDICINSSTCMNRENIGQLHEISLTHIGKSIVDYIKMNLLSTEESFDMILKFMSLLSEPLVRDMKVTLSRLTSEEKDVYLQSILDAGNIYLSLKPISESVNLDKLNTIYKEFPWIKQRVIESPIVGSNGKLRFIPARRSSVVGHIYMYRLKQYAEEKHSVTSLSSVNIRNENSRSKANKAYKILHKNTPIQFGDMESGDLSHLGLENVISILMIHSVSPKARRLVEKIYTEDPYQINIELDSESSNRKAEILNAYMKAIGYKFNFIKKLKKKSPLVKMKPFHIETARCRIGSILPENEVIDPRVLAAQINSYKNAKPICKIQPYIIDEKENNNRGDSNDSKKD